MNTSESEFSDVSSHEELDSAVAEDISIAENVTVASIQRRKKL